MSPRIRRRQRSLAAEAGVAEIKALIGLPGHGTVEVLGDESAKIPAAPAQGFEPLRLVDRVAVIEVDGGRGLGRRAPDCSSTDDESA
jgi:hypothetical protein